MIDFLDSSFKEVNLWIHVEGLSIKCYTKEVGRKILSHFGGTGERQIREHTEEEGGTFFILGLQIHKLLWGPRYHFSRLKNDQNSPCYK